MDSLSGSSTPFSGKELPPTPKREKEDSPVPKRTPPSAPEASKSSKRPPLDSSHLEKMRERELQGAKLERELKTKAKLSSKAEKQEEEGERELQPKKSQKTSVKAPRREFKKKPRREGQEGYIVKLTKCFKIRHSEIPKSPEELAELAVSKAQKRLATSKSLNEEEILAIHDLLTDPFISGILKAKAGDVIDPIDPHPLHVFTSLSSCVKALEKHGGSCGRALDEREKIKSKVSPLVQRILQSESLAEKQHHINTVKKMAKNENPERALVGEQALKEYGQHQAALKSIPVATTQEYLNSDGWNKTYVLSGQDEHPHWIMKPAGPPESGPSRLNSRDLLLCEAGAYACNFEKQFPIPFTCLVQLGEWTVSLQRYIPDTLCLEGLPEGAHVEGLHELAVFDLLLGNTDRHAGNILFLPSRDVKQGSYQAIGIDHDRCFLRNPKPKFDIGYKNRPEMQAPFPEKLLKLLSEENVEKYKIIARSLPDSTPDQLNWIDSAADYLRKSITEKTQVKFVILGMNARLIAFKLNKKIKNKKPIK